MAKVTEDHRARQVGEIEAARQTLAEYQCVIVPERRPIRNGTSRQPE
jgi:hypothetical protein